MVLHNIIQNALHYGAGRVQLSLEKQGDSLLLLLDDNGPGIPEAERSEVLKPFYRLPQKTAVKGHGIGLALVERISLWHQGQLRLESAPDLGGLRVVLALPLSRH